jgi:hypothetical protein
VHTPAAAAPAPGATRLRPLIYVYELPPRFNAHLLQYRNDKGSCVHRFFNAENETLHVDPNVYNTETGLHEMLLQSEHRTLDPEVGAGAMGTLPARGAGRPGSSEGSRVPTICIGAGASLKLCLPPNLGQPCASACCRRPIFSSCQPIPPALSSPFSVSLPACYVGGLPCWLSPLPVLCVCSPPCRSSRLPYVPWRPK